MRARSLWRGGKWAAPMILAAAMTGLGATYAGWSDTLHVAGELTTGAFDMAADPSGEYQVSLVTPEGRAFAELPGVEARTEEDGKSVELSFSAGLPARYLRDGYYLRLSVPIENGGGTFTNIRRYEPDFSKERSRIPLRVEEICLLADGAVYFAADGAGGLGAALSDFDRPLELAVYPSFEGEPDSMRGNLYLGLTEESLQQLAAFPEELRLSAEDLDLALRGRPVQLLKAEDPETTGVLVRYRCEVSLDMDQSHEPDLIARGGEGESQ